MYDRWFGLLAKQLDADRKVGFVGIRWPSQLWRDEPIPEFPSAAPPGAAGAAELVERRTVAAGPPTIDPGQLDDLKDMFPTGAAQLDNLAQLLAEPPSQQGMANIFAAMQSFYSATATGFNDGEAEPSAQPGMLTKDPVKIFTEFADRLAESGMEFGQGGGAADLDDFGAEL